MIYLSLVGTENKCLIYVHCVIAILTSTYAMENPESRFDPLKKLFAEFSTTFPAIVLDYIFINVYKILYQAKTFTCMHTYFISKQI